MYYSLQELQDMKTGQVLVIITHNIVNNSTIYTKIKSQEI